MMSTEHASSDPAVQTRLRRPTEHRGGSHVFRGSAMNLRTFSLILLALLLIASLPNWPHSVEWGYLPSGVFAVLFVTIVALLLTRWI